ncbi:MAG TPA: dihydrodipicolinate reductase, partial [Bryobacteraceae bacterium]
MPNLAILGYGKMGRLIDQLAPEYNFTVTARIDVNRDEPLSGADVAVEFSTPSAVLDNIRKVSAAGLPLVVGTTGWLDHLAEAKSIIDAGNSALVWSPNFSVGVNVFTRLVLEAAR